MQNKVKLSYTDHQSHSCCADKNPYRQDGRADKDTYQHDGRAYSLSRIFRQWLHNSPCNFSPQTFLNSEGSFLSNVLLCNCL